MKKLAIVVLLLIAMFPPCDRQVSYTELSYGKMVRTVRMKNEGFMPIWEVGGMVTIRWPQLGLQLGVVAVGAWLLNRPA